MEPTTTTAEIPEKLFYKASEVCQITDTQPYVLRFWESEFPQLASEKNRSGQRVYRRQDIDLVLKIKRLLYQEEYTIAGARKAIDDERATVTNPAPAKGRSRRAEPIEVAAEPPASVAPIAAASPAPLFDASTPEPLEGSTSATATLAAAAAEDGTPYRELYHEATAALNELRERNLRLAARLESFLS